MLGKIEPCRIVADRPRRGNGRRQVFGRVRNAKSACKELLRRQQQQYTHPARGEIRQGSPFGGLGNEGAIDL
jgi:hypothetical protein